MQRPDKDSAISTDALFGNLTRIRNVILPAPVRRGLNTGRGLLAGFIVVHLVFLVFAASLSLRGEAFSDTFIYREWAMAGFNDANLSGGPSPWVYPILALIPMAVAGLAGPGPFFFLWVLMTTLRNGWALLKLTSRGHDSQSNPAGGWWQRCDHRRR